MCKFAVCNKNYYVCFYNYSTVGFLLQILLFLVNSPILLLQKNYLPKLSMLFGGGNMWNLFNEMFWEEKEN